MPHEIPLTATVAVGLALAFLLGLLANKVRLPPIVARAQSGEAVEHLRTCGAGFVLMGEEEIARGMARHVLGR